MQKKLYLHIGSGKTGTSSLQSFLSNNRDWLRDRGYLVPESEFNSHHPLAFSIINAFTGHKRALQRPFKGDYKTLWDRFHKETSSSDCPRVIISSEIFPNLYRPESRSQSLAMMRWLGRALEDFDVFVVCYLRALDKHVKSEYKFSVRASKNTSALAEHLSNKIASSAPITGPTAYLDLFAEQFGIDHLILRQYDRRTLVNGDIVDDFLDLVGLPAQDGQAGARTNNPSLPTELVDMKRTFNALSGATPLECRRIGTKMARQSKARFDARPVDGGQAIRQALQAEHDQLSEKYGLDLGEVGDPFGDTNPASVEAQGQTVFISELYKQVRESQKTLDELRTEVQELRAQNDKLIRNRTSIRQRFKSLFRKLVGRSRRSTNTKQSAASR